MKYLKYGFYAVIHKPIFNILIIIEIAAILISVNMTVSIFNFRSVLYDPFADILSQDGYVFQSRIVAYDKDLVLKTLCDSLEGDVTVINTYHFNLQLDKNDMLSSSANIYSIDECIYSKYRLPLLCGRWASSEKNSNGEIEAVMIGGRTIAETQYSLNTVFDTDIGKIRIVGIIASNSYAPYISTRTYSKQLDIRTFYDIAENYGSPNDIFVCSSADKALRDPVDTGYARTFMYYNSEPTEEIRERNKERLMAQTKQLSELSVYKNNSDEYLAEQYKKLIPVLFCVFIIVIGELICSVAMNTKSQMKNYGIYFLCGCRWRKCLNISLTYSAIILFCGTILGTVAFLLFQTTEYAAVFEQNLAMNNIYVTVAIFAVMLILSLIIPFFQVRKTSPVQTIKEN